MAAVQTAWLTKLRKEKGLLYAVNRAGPFIVTSLGPAESAAPAASAPKAATPPPSATPKPAALPK